MTELAINTGSLLILVGLPALGTSISALKRHLLLASIGGLLTVTMFVVWN